MTNEIRINETRTDEIRDEALHRAVQALPREMAPERDLWPGIAVRIAPHRRRMQPWPVAAGITGFVAISAIAVALSMQGRQELPATLATTRQPATTASSPDERARMIATAIRRSTHQDPHTQAVLLTNLDLVEASITHIQQAMDEDPGNPGLQPLLYQQYRNEATLVATAQQVQLQTTTGVIAP
jgi:hypothetical protein